eukprot:COSAG02_NODE_7994_length_2755_cov_5.373117_5_plen_93_part_00
MRDGTGRGAGTGMIQPTLKTVLEAAPNKRRFVFLTGGLRLVARTLGQAGIALIREAAEGHKQVLGEQHTDTIDALASLAEQEALVGTESREC